MSDQHQDYNQNEHNNANSDNKSGYHIKEHKDMHTPPPVLIILIIGAIILASAGSLFLRNRLAQTQNPEFLKKIQSGLSFHLVKDQAMAAVQLEPVDAQTELVLLQPATKSTSVMYFKVKKEPAMQGIHVIRALLEKDDMGNDIVKISLDPDGARQFAEVTGQNIGMQLAMVFNNQVISAPVIQSRITGGEAQINGRNVNLILQGLQTAEKP
ncbi:MAG: hypothetical protein CVV42_13725 [Candidatus Riflebacteria bacterium HGW-Riflebacteria-2]|jgi:preprotein translocase subunit SecD|nr:MAG: hypothetical protein CVV42_13725 [Candidatus Riflebacteria bacterium HGW-Riflebacteria-2]